MNEKWTCVRSRRGLYFSLRVQHFVLFLKIPVQKGIRTKTEFFSFYTFSVNNLRFLLAL